MNKLEMNLKLADTIEYSALFITPEQFKSDVELLQEYYSSKIPDRNQLKDILDYCEGKNKKVCYLFTKTNVDYQFTANIGEVFFANGMFFDFDTQTFSTKLSK